MNQNTPLIIGIIIAVIVIGYGYYFMFGRKRLNKQLGIDSDDSMYRVYNAYVDVNVSAAKQAALLAVGLLLGTVASYRSPRLTVSITKNGIVALGNLENSGGEVVRFTPDVKPTVTIVENGPGTMSGWDKMLESTRIVEIIGRSGEDYRLIMPKSGAEELVVWSKR